VRRQATDSYPRNVSPPPTFETAADTIDEQSPTVELPQIDTQLGEASPADQREMSPRGRPRARREAREQMLFGSQTRFASPEARFVCDGWCKYSEEPHSNVVSIEHLFCWGTVGLMFVASSLYPPARTCNARGKAPKAR
jgi:hypothetical protein